MTPMKIPFLVLKFKASWSEGSGVRAGPICPYSEKILNFILCWGLPQVMGKSEKEDRGTMSEFLKNIPCKNLVFRITHCNQTFCFIMVLTGLEKSKSPPPSHFFFWEVKSELERLHNQYALVRAEKASNNKAAFLSRKYLKIVNRL